MPDRLPPPGPSYVREQELRVRERALRVGMSRPTTTDDGWWLAVVWVLDESGVVSFRDLASAAGPPAVPPLLRLGPAMAGELSGWIIEEDGRLAVRLNVVAPADDPVRPWEGPAALRLAMKLEPMRAAASTPNEVARTILSAAVHGLSALSRP